MIVLFGACCSLLVGSLVLPLPPAADAGGRGSADSMGFADFVQFAGIHYVRNWRGVDDLLSRPLERADLGPVYAYTAYQPGASVDDPASYRPQDGDAPFLPPGTPVHEVPGFAPWFRLAAVVRAEAVVYEAVSNRRAERGADLLDIAGKVAWIGVLSARDFGELASIRDPAKVERLVGMVLDAPVPDPTGGLDFVPHFYVAFYLDDGTASLQSMSLANHLLGPHIRLPVEFEDAILGAAKGEASLGATPAASRAIATPDPRLKLTSTPAAAQPGLQHP